MPDLKFFLQYDYFFGNSTNGFFHFADTPLWDANPDFFCFLYQSGLAKGKKVKKTKSYCCLARRKPTLTER